jgi:hypothetical protein
MVMHYEQHVTLKKIEDIFGINKGSICNIFHNIASIFKLALPKLIEEFLKAVAKHADETKWRTYGLGGFLWAFLTEYISLFQITNTRASTVPLGIFGKSKMGYLTVDRYAGYSRICCKIQYCYAHLLRTVKDLSKEFKDNKEVQDFVNIFGTFLSDAMKQNASDVLDFEYYKKAKKIKKKILNAVDSPAKNFGMKNIQFIFKKNENRLFHWVDS